MKELIIQFNRPLLIDCGTMGQTNYNTIYGFIARSPYNPTVVKNIHQYVKYLAAMHELSNGAEDFAVSGDNWVDKNNEEHILGDEWSESIAEKAAEKLNLDCAVYELDMDRISDFLFTDGTNQNFIIDESLMKLLIDTALVQKRESVFLFNRPVFLPKDKIWEGEKGYCHIYGIAIDKKLDSTLIREAIDYLGFLAMAEEYYSLSGTTPSGYWQIDYSNDTKWYDDSGISIGVHSKAMQAEGQLCREKGDLSIVEVRREALSYGVRDSFIISLDLYESLRGKPMED